MIHGYDLSRYDTLEDVQPDFVILNVEDPGFGEKVGRAVERNIPWGVYLWIYPGQSPAVAWAHDKTVGLGHGEPPVGYWADYEQAGVTPDQLTSWFAQCDQFGLKAGYYSGPTIVDHTPFLSRPWWCAAYPGTNDGTYPGVDALWASSRPRPMQLWQYTSTNGTLDQDSVEDPEWWATWLGAPVPTPPAKRKRKRMFVAQSPAGFWLIGDESIQALTADDQVQIAAGLGQPNNLPVKVSDTFINDRIALAAKYADGSGTAATIPTNITLTGKLS